MISEMNSTNARNTNNINNNLYHQQEAELIMMARPLFCNKRAVPLVSSASYDCAALNINNTFEAQQHQQSFKKRRLIQRRSVRFADYVTIQSVPATPKEDTWYQRHELASFKQDSKNTVYALYHSNNTTPSKDDCIRGLEQVLSPEAALEQRSSRQERIAAVLYQQHVQQQLGTSNPEFLGMVSSLMSEPKRQEAIQMGMMDAQIWNQVL